MKINSQVIETWQSLWNTICNMAYYRKGIVKHITTDSCEYNSILRYHSLKYLNFDEITLDHTWKKYSSTKNENGDFLQPLLVPELEEIYVPRILFTCPGVFQWFQHSFPNCSISFWEDDM